MLTEAGYRCAVFIGNSVNGWRWCGTGIVDAVRSVGNHAAVVIVGVITERHIYNHLDI